MIVGVVLIPLLAVSRAQDAAETSAS